jgi:hypothetical protein
MESSAETKIYAGDNNTPLTIEEIGYYIAKATWNRDQSVIKLIQSVPTEALGWKNEYGETLLSLALHKVEDDIALALIDAMTIEQLKAKNNYGRTSLFFLNKQKARNPKLIEAYKEKIGDRGLFGFLGLGRQTKPTITGETVSLEDANAVFLKPEHGDVVVESVKQSQYNLTKVTRDIAGGMGDYVVQTATGIGMLAVGAVTGIKNLLAKKEDRAPKKTLAERAADVGHALRSEALATTVASMAVTVGMKALLTALTASAGLAVAPILIAGGVTAGVATIIKTRNEWRRDTINDARIALADKMLSEQGWKMPDSVALNGQDDTPELRAKIELEHLYEAREDILKSVTPKEYTERLGLGHLNVFKMFADQHARGKTFKNIGYGLAAGITAGAAAMITGSLTHKDAPPATSGNTNQIPVSNPSADVSATPAPAPTPAPVAVIQPEQASTSVTTTVSAPSVTAPAIPADASLLEKAKLLADAKGADSNYFLSRLAAAEHGNAQALKDVAQSMINIDEKTALELYRESAKLGNAQAIRDLASLGHPFTPAVAAVSDATTSLSPVPVAPSVDTTLPLKFHWNPDGTIVNGQNPSTIIPFTRPSVVPPSNELPVDQPKPEPQIIGVNLPRPTGAQIAAQPLACLDTRASIIGEVACADVNTKPFDLTESLTYGDYAEIRYGSTFERLFANPGEALTDFFNRLRGHLPAANERLILANTAVTEGRDVASALPPSASVRIVGGTDFVTGRAPVSAPTAPTQTFMSSAADPSVVQPPSASVASADSAFNGGVALDMSFDGMNGNEFDQIPWYRRALSVY